MRIWSYQFRCQMWVTLEVISLKLLLQDLSRHTTRSVPHKTLHLQRRHIVYPCLISQRQWQSWFVYSIRHVTLQHCDSKWRILWSLMEWKLQNKLWDYVTTPGLLLETPGRNVSSCWWRQLITQRSRQFSARPKDMPVQLRVSCHVRYF